MHTPAVLYIALLAGKVTAHSWARCTKYGAEITGGDYSEDECSGWIRGWEFDGIDFGADRGINYQVSVGGGQSLCQSGLSGSADTNYGFRDDKTPMYTAGETVRVVWPAKNHANYECSNNIPDASMKLFMNPNVNPTADLSNSASTMEANGYELVKDWQDGCVAGSDGCGFQNCPKFCDNTDRATCFGDFVVPEVDTSGYYTFVWYWIFNPGSPYITCYEAYVDAEAADVTEETEFTESAGDGNSGTRNGYLTQAPYCISGDEYDAETVLGFTRGQFSGVVDDYENNIDILDVSEGTDGFNFTVQISHDDGGADIIAVAWAGTTADESPFCEQFEIQYSGSVCTNCVDTITYALFEDNGSGAQMHMVGFASAFVFVGMLMVFV